MMPSLQRSIAMTGKAGDGKVALPWQARWACMMWMCITAPVSNSALGISILLPT
jgi:hypothetical protein